jgi:hypothetical protein
MREHMADFRTTNPSSKFVFPLRIGSDRVPAREVPQSRIDVRIPAAIKFR